MLLTEFKEIFSDVPKVTNLIEHKVELSWKWTEVIIERYSEYVSSCAISEAHQSND